jgi:hypothetical protein
MRMRSLRLLFILAALISIVGVSAVWADCQGTETTGDDTIVCDNTPPPAWGVPVTGNAGDDSITVEAGTLIVTGVTGDGIGGNPSHTPISTNPGDDTIVIDGTVQYVQGNGGDDTIIVGSTGQVTNTWDGVYGDSPVYTSGPQVVGNDTIIIEGDVAGTVDGGGGDDTITISGSVIMGVQGGAGDDTIILEDGAGANGAYSLYLNGGTGPGQDTLVFKWTITDQETYDILSNLIAANVSSGSITIGGEVYYWYNFETLVNMLTLLLGQPGQVTDGRLNNDPGQTAVLYCDHYEGGMYALSVNGGLLFNVSQTEIDNSVGSAANVGENQFMAEGEGQSFWGLTSNEVLLHDNGGHYDFVVPSNACVLPE